MNTYSLVILGITVYFLLFGLIYGLKRGAFRSVLRLLTVGVAFAASWFCKDLYVAAVMDLQIGDFSIRALLADLGAEMPSISSILTTLVEIALGVVLFILVFLVLKLVTMLIFAILSVFLPKKGRMLGLAVGALQGLLIAFCICAPLNGLLLDAGKVTTALAGDLIEMDAEMQETVQQTDADLKEYSDGVISKIYTALGGSFYKALSTVEDEETGKEVNFSGYADATVVSTKFAEELASISNINMEEGFTAENRDALHQTFKNLDAIKGDMSEESITIVNDMISAVVSDAAMELPKEVKDVLENFDISEVNFEKEGDVILHLYDFIEEENSTVSATDIVNALAESTVILPVLESMMTSEGPILELPDAQTEAEVAAAIHALEDAEAAELLREIFGLAA